MKIIRLLIAFVIIGALAGCAPATRTVVDKITTPVLVSNPLDSKMATDWMGLLCRLIESEGKSPPQASRIIAYSGIALYESCLHAMGGYRSLSGQLNSMPSMPQPESGQNYDWPIVVASTMSEVMSGLFNGSEKAVADISALRDAGYSAKHVAPDILSRSEDYGKQIGQSLLSWADTDGFKETRSMTYTPPQGEGLWVPTAPGYKPPLEPYWDMLRPFALYSVDTCIPPAPFSYSTDKNSTYYQQAMAVYKASKALTDEQVAIGLFWADNAGESFTPPGHWLSIENQMVDQLNLPMEKAAELYALAGVASADAFISCWHAKFQYCVMRPITYINANIDPSWQPMLFTPAFPEYTSGHSVASGAIATVLSSLLGKATFVDNSYPDRGLPARTFNSFEAAAQEAAVSRLYAGIHYPISIEYGVKQGQDVGMNVLNRVQTKE